MTSDDVLYFDRCGNAGLIKSPFLEIGAAKVQGGAYNFCDIAKKKGVERAVGTDLTSDAGVDFTFDFSVDEKTFRDTWKHGHFATVTIFNVLEHTFDPVRVLTNAAHCLAPGGSLLVLVPSVWPIHSFPKDFQRLLPDWFIEFAQRQQLELTPDHFCWISQFGIQRVDLARVENEYSLPGYTQTPGVPKWKSLRSRLIHRLFNTYGRNHIFSYSALGAVLRKD